VATELRAAKCPEIPDVIGFRSTCCTIVEAKVSRPDFLADARKPWRTGETLALGHFRFFICPQGLISPDELPPKWGLLYATGDDVIDVKRPVGNLWSRHTTIKTWADYVFDSDLEKEHAILFSIARRQAALQRSQPTQ
jgi:hypothetical protein